MRYQVRLWNVARCGFMCLSSPTAFSLGAPLWMSRLTNELKLLGDVPDRELRVREDHELSWIWFVVATDTHCKKGRA